MSEKNFLSDLVQSIKVPADITKAAMEPSAKQIGQGLGDLFYIAFSPVIKAKYKKEAEITRFKEEIEKELAKIPPEQLVEPPLNVVGPALEASKYYIENENLRSMFTKLIASSMNRTTCNKAHTSFVEIIKQLSPLDAQNFTFLVQDNNFGVARISLQKKGDSSILDWIRYYFPFPQLSLANEEDYSSSVDNLVRLGLIDLDFGNTFVNESKYEFILNHQFYQECQDEVNNDPDLEEFKIKLYRGVCSITSFGKKFAHCCL
ncbi:DUF4393 domain-containing protein [Yersinia pestis]|uniref:DUF4393 domain-containing protein n=1 Tax=Paenibacillus lautus TaxID=1401 RepID=UPI00256D428A|nr:DUF4393 domain-containing protein [Paenibacillus lautus]MDL1163026.1 DUF4393 domain-containing protein [Yersinia pestis]MEC0257710.1 DUF4393 domain-containing protein [Paenibacillus lautus]